MSPFKIKNTDYLLRAFYQLTEAAEIIGCDVKDILWFSLKKGIELCMEFYDDELEVSNGLDSDIENAQLLTEIKSLKKDGDGYYVLSENCTLRLHPEQEKYDENGFLTCYIKGFFAINDEYKEHLVKHEGQPDEWPEYFIPSGNSNLDFPVRLFVNYDERENYYLLDTLWITKKQIGFFLREVAEQQKPQKSEKNYQAQSEAQKQKHAVPRVEVLMAIVALYHRDMNLRRESPTAIADYLFLHARDFWPEKGVPPLSYDTIVNLLRKSMRKGGLTFQ